MYRCVRLSFFSSNPYHNLSNNLNSSVCLTCSHFVLRKNIETLEIGFLCYSDIQSWVHHAMLLSSAVGKCHFLSFWFTEAHKKPSMSLLAHYYICVGTYKLFQCHQETGHSWFDRNTNITFFLILKAPTYIHPMCTIFTWKYNILAP